VENTWQQQRKQRQRSRKQKSQPRRRQQRRNNFFLTYTTPFYSNLDTAFLLKQWNFLKNSISEISGSSGQDCTTNFRIVQRDCRILTSRNFFYTRVLGKMGYPAIVADHFSNRSPAV